MNKAADGSCKALQHLGNQSSTSGERNWGFNCGMFYSPFRLDAEITTWICFLCERAAGQTWNDLKNKQRTISFKKKIIKKTWRLDMELWCCCDSKRSLCFFFFGFYWNILRLFRERLFNRFLWDFGFRGHKYNMYLTNLKKNKKKVSLNLSLGEVCASGNKSSVEGFGLNV